jgi:hypothetical protein
MKLNKLFKRLAITADARNFYHLLPNNGLLKIMGLTIHVAVVSHHTLIVRQ